MKIDKERCKKVVTAIDEVAATTSNYTFDQYCREHGIYSDSDRVRINGLVICCPFHHDSKPSCTINEEKRKYNCFGCGAHGDYVNFVTQYEKEVLGKEITYYQKLNELLSSDLNLQARVGFNTIYCKEQPGMASLKKLQFSAFKPNMSAEITFPELATKMIKEKSSFQEIKYALILMQQGLSPNEVEKQIKKERDSNVVETKKQYSMEELSKDSEVQ